MFRCEQDILGHITFGSHDGIGSWTINLDVLPESSQDVVTQHEHAHHYLQSSSTWGVAMIAAAIVDEAGEAAAATWIALAQGCQSVHEMFATYTSATAITNGLEHYRGNLMYLRFYGMATALLGALPISPIGQKRALEDLSRALMSPVWLQDLDFHATRLLGSALTDRPDLPDARLAVLKQALKDDALAGPLCELFEHVEDSHERWDLLATQLRPHGIGCPSLEQFAQWVATTVEKCNTYLPTPIEVTGRNQDPLLSLVENHSRERLRLHPQRLVLDVGRAADHLPRPARDFAREAAGVGPHVWLTWLPADFVARQFVMPGPLSAPLVLALLACDRRGSTPHAFMTDFSPAQPAVVATALLQTPIRPLFFTTVRALHHSPADVDFQAWDPVLVLVDSDAPHFITHLRDLNESYFWDTAGITGSRSLDFLLITAESAPALTYLFPCSLPAGRIMSAWLESMPETFLRSRERFFERRNWLQAQIDHLVGTFYQLDQFGADVNLNAPVSRGQV